MLCTIWKSGNTTPRANTWPVPFCQVPPLALLDVTLQESGDCQLVIVAHGDGKTVKTDLGTNTLQNVQENITADLAVINGIDPSNQTSMNKMPYVLHLKHVKIVKEEGTNKYIIQSPDGAYDVRLRLKRLATRLTVTWTYTVSDFDMKQILIQSVPWDIP